MTIQHRAALVLQQIDDALALAEKATPGPWQVTGCDKHANKDTAYIKVRGTRLGAKWQIADVRFIEAENFSGQKEAQQLAAFIAASRTLLPASLRCLKAAIEVFLNDKVWNELYKQYVRRHDSLTVLTTILDQWEAKQ